uniref:Uncharacterized protein n=1 Tax=Arion vulgaris TaxID=1028688 RepID=A0A0B7BFG4_9EUPU
MSVDGNEREGRLTGSVTMGQLMDRADILNGVRQCGSKRDFHLNQSMSTARLK